jgi:hypothetical protein
MDEEFIYQLVCGILSLLIIIGFACYLIFK